MGTGDPWIQSTAIVAALMVGTITIIFNMVIARRRATLDVLMVEQTNTDWIQMRRKFVGLKASGHLVQWVAPDKLTSEEFTVIKSYLNRYELISIAIREGTLSGKLYKRWWRSTFVEDWMAVKPLVVQLRKDHVLTYYIEFESLAKKWANDKERPHC